MALLKKENLRLDWCKGCGYCVFHCPKEALKIGDKLNKTGFAYVELDEEKCVSCGICRLMCPDCVFVFTDDDEEVAG